MKPEKVEEACATYAMMLAKQGVSPKRDTEIDMHGLFLYQDEERVEALMGHLAWMAEQIPVFMKSGRVEKAMRWLGFLQGIFWVLGFRSMEEMKKDNKSNDEEFSKERI